MVLPWRSNGKESACRCRGHEFNPWSGKIPQGAELQSRCAATTEPVPRGRRATATEPACHDCWIPGARSRAQQQKKPLQCEVLESQGKVAPVRHNQRNRVTATNTHYRKNR